MKHNMHFFKTMISQKMICAETLKKSLFIQKADYVGFHSVLGFFQYFTRFIVKPHSNFFLFSILRFSVFFSAQTTQ